MVLHIVIDVIPELHGVEACFLSVWVLDYYSLPVVIRHQQARFESRLRPSFNFRQLILIRTLKPSFLLLNHRTLIGPLPMVVSAILPNIESVTELTLIGST